MTQRLPRAADRTVAVLSGGSQGTGVLISQRTVLTCAHVLDDTGNVTVGHPFHRGLVRYEVTWADRDLDLALLGPAHAERRQATYPFGRMRRLRLGGVSGGSPVPGCVITGFPDIQRFGPDDALDYDQFEGTVLPLAGSLRGSLTFELARPSVAEPTPGFRVVFSLMSDLPPDDGGSPLEGLSGAPIFAGEVLLGIVRQVPRDRNHVRVEGIPLQTLREAAAGPAWPSSVPRVFQDRTGVLPSTWTKRGGEPTRLWEEVTESHARDQAYEEEYARAIRARYRKTRIFGIDGLDTHDTSWDLDTAYLSLEAAPPEHSAGRQRLGPSVASHPRRINELLTDRPRILLRGEAGAGKTTLVWWLAAHTADHSLDRELAELNGLVPFVVPLRNLRTQGADFPAPSRLPEVARLQVGDAPEGWAARVLRAGRALLLVDGLDEVPTAEREEARAWLAELLDLYPRTRCLATVRPGAVDDDWLYTEKFEELALLPLRDEDIQAFVAAWHRTARKECDAYADQHRAREEREELAELEAGLLRQFTRNPALQSLARTPLLCAVICTLHRRRGGLLPDTRWELYRSALAMLLGARDHQRRIGSPEGITMGMEEHQELLQAIAVWLVRNGQNQLSPEEAVHQIAAALRAMPQVRAQGTARAVLTHLVNRSGLLQERADDAIQFIHRTFQDYLAAKALVDGGGLRELLKHADDEQWQDVVRLAVGHCRPNERTTLIEGLILRGDAGDDEHREVLHILAARCAQETVVLTDEVRDAVDDRIRALLPPLDYGAVHRLALLGPDVLRLLPEPDGLGEVAAMWAAELIGIVGGKEAIPYARKFMGHPSKEVRQRLAANWSRFPLEQYASRVLSGLRMDDVAVVVVTARQLELLTPAGPVNTVWLGYPATEEELRRCLPRLELRTLGLYGSGLTPALGFLRGLTTVRSLYIPSSRATVPALSELNQAPHISILRLELASLSDFSALEQSLPAITQFTAHLPADASGVAELPRVFPSLTRLSLHFEAAPEGYVDLTPLAVLPGVVIHVAAVRRRNLIIGAELFGDRLFLPDEEEAG